MSRSFLARHSARLVRDIPHQKHVNINVDGGARTIYISVGAMAPADDVVDILAHLTATLDPDRINVADRGRILYGTYEGEAVVITSGDYHKPTVLT